MTEYTAEDGLKILKYLELPDLTEQEKEAFRERWASAYDGRNMVFTTWDLYSKILPLISGVNAGSFLTAQRRDREFRRRLEATCLDKRIDSCISLQEIFASVPERFQG